MRYLSRILWPRSSAGTIIIKDDQVLALDLGECLTLPIGGSDIDETFEETAVRETEEETGLEVEIKDRVIEQLNSNGGVEVLFTAEVIGGELKGNLLEGEPVWIELGEAEKRRWRYNRDIGRLVEKANSVRQKPD